MERGNDLLSSLEVASPCRASWEAMSGDDRVRFCDQCAKKVYNLSGMSRREAEALIRESEGRLCVRFYRRRDGTVLTDNCPVGLRAARRWAQIQLAGISALLGGLLALLGRPMLSDSRATMGMAPRSQEDAQADNRHDGGVGVLKPIPNIWKSDRDLMLITGRVVDQREAAPATDIQIPNADSPPAPNGLHLALDPKYREIRASEQE
jgi:hypothetical protein